VDTEQFFARILPSEGNYALAVFNPRSKAPKHHWFDSLADMADAALTMSAEGKNVYHAMGAFTGNKRKAVECRALKSFFIDVDCGPGKPFADWKEGLGYTIEYIRRMKLPKPTVVRSGNGLHFYWPLDDDVSKEDWLPIARALKASFPTRTGQDGEEKPVFDPAVPADAARVLRPVGTINPKGGNIVSLIYEGPVTTLEAMRVAVGNHIPKPEIPAVKSSILAAMAVDQDFPPADPGRIYAKCRQVSWAVDNQDKVGEPLWYALLGIAAFCENPEDIALEWSQGHPAFDPGTTIRKMEHWRENTTGPATCARFERERPAGCTNCPFKGEITTPARLGIVYEEITTPIEVPSIETDDPPDILPLPAPFKRTVAGITYTVNDVETPLCPFDIYPVSYGRDEGHAYEVCRYHWNRPKVGWQELSLRQALLTDGSGKEFASAIADQGILLESKKQTEVFQMLLRRYIEDLKKVKTLTNSHSSMGWKGEHNDQFLLGDKLFKKEAGKIKTEHLAPLSTGKQMSMGYHAGGSAETWTRFTESFERAGMHLHKFIMGVGFSTPMYKACEFNGATINIYGPTGAGKTLAQLAQQSIYGKPTDLMITAQSTQNALFNRLALHNNLPVCIDEATTMNPKDVGSTLYWISQGRDKLRQAKTLEERETKTWQTAVTLSSNRSLATAMISAGYESDAQTARLLELQLEPHILFVKDSNVGENMHRLMNTHYGHAGPVMIQMYMEMGDAEMYRLYKAHQKAFLKQYSAAFGGHERYWQHMIVKADLGNKLALERGLIRYDYTTGTESILAQLGVMRATIKDNNMDTFDLIAAYLNEFADTGVSVISTGAHKPMADLNRLPRGEVRIRFELFRKDSMSKFDRGTVYLHRKHFKYWLASKGADYRILTRDLDYLGINATPSIGKAYLAKDTPIRMGQEYVLGVDLNHPKLVGILNDADEAHDASVMSHLKVVK
jgi:hypothetical protein